MLLYVIVCSVVVCDILQRIKVYHVTGMGREGLLLGVQLIYTQAQDVLMPRSDHIDALFNNCLYLFGGSLS